MIGYVECEWRMELSQSLKDKRAILQRVLSRVKQTQNVSIAEVDHQDKWQRTTIALVTVAASRQACEKNLQYCLALMDSFPEWERGQTSYEWL